ncbi:MAG: DUF2878 family protein [Bacillota bacterium]
MSKDDSAARSLDGLGQMTSTVLFLVGVVACYYGAISGLLWVGPLVVAVIGAVKFVFSPDWILDLKLVLLVGMLGLVVETLLILFGVYTPAPLKRIWLFWPFLPEWILALWINFGFRLKSLIPMMYGRMWLSWVTGFVFGILIFKSAQIRELLVLDLGNISLLIIAGVWAVSVYLIFYYGAIICYREE